MFRLFGGFILEQYGFLFWKCRAVAWNRLGYGSLGWCCLWTVDVVTVGAIPVVCITSLYCFRGYKMKLRSYVVGELPNNCEVLLDSSITALR